MSPHWFLHISVPLSQKMSTLFFHLLRPKTVEPSSNPIFLSLSSSKWSGNLLCYMFKNTCRGFTFHNFFLRYCSRGLADLLLPIVPSKIQAQHNCQYDCLNQMIPHHWWDPLPPHLIQGKSYHCYKALKIQPDPMTSLTSFLSFYLSTAVSSCYSASALATSFS